jgi:hypothetical protein
VFVRLVSQPLRRAECTGAVHLPYAVITDGVLYDTLDASDLCHAQLNYSLPFQSGAKELCWLAYAFSFASSCECTHANYICTG